MDIRDIRQLRRRAQRKGLLLKKDRRMPYDAWYVVDANMNAVISNGSLTLEEIELWLDDFEKE